MFLHHFICSVHFSTVQKHTGFETIPHLYWKNDKGVLRMVFSLLFFQDTLFSDEAFKPATTNCLMTGVWSRGILLSLPGVCPSLYSQSGVYHVYLRYISTSSSSSQIFGQTYLFDNVGKFYLRSGPVSDNVRSHV